MLVGQRARPLEDDLSIHHSIHQSVSLSIHARRSPSLVLIWGRTMQLALTQLDRTRSKHLSIHPSIYPSINLPISLSLYLAGYLSIYPSLTAPWRQKNMEARLGLGTGGHASHVAAPMLPRSEQKQQKRQGPRGREEVL